MFTQLMHWTTHEVTKRGRHADPHTNCLMTKFTSQDHRKYRIKSVKSLCLSLPSVQSLSIFTLVVFCHLCFVFQFQQWSSTCPLLASIIVSYIYCRSLSLSFDPLVLFSIAFPNLVIIPSDSWVMAFALNRLLHIH